MKLAPTPRRLFAGFLLGALAGVALAWWLGRATSGAAGRAAGGEAAVARARELAAAVEAAGAEGEAARQAFAAWTSAAPAVEAARLIDLASRSLEASTDPADRERGAPPRRLAREEKPYFDVAQGLRGAVLANREEGLAREPEVRLEPRPGGGFLVSVPVLSGDAVVGMAQIATAAPAAAAVEGLGRAAAWAAGALVVFAGVLAAARRRPAIAAAAGAGLVVAAAVGAARTGPVMVAPWAPVAVAALLYGLVGLGVATLAGRALRRYHVAYAYALPAMLGLLILTFLPFLYGVALSFTNANIYNSDQPLRQLWVGLQNFRDILGDFEVAERTAAGWAVDFRNFYYTLFFTVVWTAANVAIGVTVGLLLALTLNTRGLALKPVYRVLFILPWAMPNYITALIWKGMFHQQFGVINQVIAMLGGSPVAWFERPLTSFATVLATNGWLSFPFMTVISLGALQSIPADLYEAARVDGASRWQQFRSITLPSLKPALVPAIIISVIWTFNMFNIIYLVSQGEPAGSTEILITQAYKLAFEQYRYGYAAAYSMVIFFILFLYGTWQNRVTRATEAI